MNSAFFRLLIVSQEIYRKRAARTMWLSFIFVFVMLSFFDITWADWTVYKSAEVKNEKGDILRLDTGPDNSVRIWLVMNRKYAHKSRLPLYQVDAKPVVDVKTIKNVKVKANKWLRWKISRKRNKPDANLLDIMNGKKITFQYYLPDGTIKETTFDLTGAQEAIAEIIK